MPCQSHYNLSFNYLHTSNHLFLPDNTFAFKLCTESDSSSFNTFLLTPLASQVLEANASLT